MDNNLIKKINSKYLGKELDIFKIIYKTVLLNKKQQKEIEEILNLKSRGREIVAPLEDSLEDNQRVLIKIGSIVYHLLKNNNLELTKLVRKYSKKINRGSKPNIIVSESTMKIKSIVNILKKREVIFSNDKGLSLNNSFRQKIISKILK